MVGLHFHRTERGCFLTLLRIPRLVDEAMIGLGVASLYLFHHIERFVAPGQGRAICCESSAVLLVADVFAANGAEP